MYNVYWFVETFLYEYNFHALIHSFKCRLKTNPKHCPTFECIEANLL